MTGDPAPGAAARPKRPRYEGDPSLGRVMRRPQWIGALLLALIVAAAFAWLGQWQLGHAISTDSGDTASSETPRLIAEVTAPATSVTDTAAGMVVALSGTLAPGDFSVIEQRVNGDETGAWLVGHFVVTAEDAGGGANGAGSAAEPAHLAVALGWAPDAAAAGQALELVEADLAVPGAVLDIAGRYMPSDGPTVPGAAEDPGRLATMVPAQLVNLWQPFAGPAYGGFLVLHPGESLGEDVLGAYGLTAIDSVPPLPAEKVNWLNLFYAVEWVVFAGFAVYFWYRLARDAWEKEHELQLLAADAQAAER